MFENNRKSLIQHWERSELRLHFELTKVNLKSQKWSIWASFWKPVACGQTVLPDMSHLIVQKIGGKNENTTNKNLKSDILSNFQTRFVDLNFQTKNIENYFSSFWIFAPKSFCINRISSWMEHCISHFPILSLD